MTDKNKRAIKLDDLFKFQWLQGATLSPDGRTVVYAVAHVEGKKDKEQEFVTLYRLDTVSSAVRKLTSGRHKDCGPALSPDGKTLAFTSDRGEKPQIYLLPLDGGEAQQLTELPQGAGNPIWSPDGSRIAFTAGVYHGEEGPPDRKKQPYRVTRHIWRFDALGDLDLAVANIHVIEVASRQARQLTGGPTADGNPKWSPDGSRILFSAAMRPDRFDAHFASLHIVDLEGAVTNVLEGWSHKDFAWLPDGERIIVVGEKIDSTIVGTHKDLYVCNLKTGTLDNRTPTLERSVQGLLEGKSATSAFALFAVAHMRVTNDGSAVIARVQNGGRVPLCRVSLSGKESVKVVIGGDRTCMLLGMAGDRLLFSADSIVNPQDLYIAGTDGSGEKRLTRLNDDLMAELQLPEPVHLRYKGKDGVDVEGWYVKPITGEGAPYPSILWIHGGPHAAQGHTFAFDTLLMNGAGYGVMFFNYRASTGYGNAFATGIFADWGNRDYGDLMAGVDKAIEVGLADPNRLGVCGLSGGGTLSCWIVGNTHRFKAAVPQNPVTNFSSFYGVSDVGVSFSVAELGGHPHEIPELYRRCSPISYAHQCTTPTLLIQCEQDWRCPPEQSEQFYTVLKANGCIVEMQRQPGASHVGSIIGPLPLRTAYLESQLGWFNKYVLGIEPPSAPPHGRANDPCGSDQ